MDYQREFEVLFAVAKRLRDQAQFIKREHRVFIYTSDFSAFCQQLKYLEHTIKGSK